MIFFAPDAWRFCADTWQQTTRRITGSSVGIHRFLKPVTVVKNADLNAVPRFVVDSVRFTSDVIINAGARDQITFVCCVHKHAPMKSSAAKHRDGFDATIHQVYAFVRTAVQPFIAKHGNVCFGDHFFKDVFRDMRFKNPHRCSVTSAARRTLIAIAELCLILPLPCVRLLIVLPDAMVEITTQPADGVLVP